MLGKSSGGWGCWVCVTVIGRVQLEAFSQDMPVATAKEAPGGELNRKGQLSHAWLAVLC